MAHVKISRILKVIGKSIVKPFKLLSKGKKKNRVQSKEQGNETEDEPCNCCFPKCKIFKKLKKKKEKIIYSQEVSVETKPCQEEEHIKSVSFSPETNADWLPDLNLSKKHREELQADDWLDDRIIDAAQKLLKRQFNTEGLQTCVLSEVQFQPVRGPSVQIHFDSERNHWLTSCFKSDHVEIADSRKAGKLPHQVKKQISECYREVIREPTKTMKQLNVDQQQNGNDCGVYAIANAFEFLSNGDPTCRYNGKTMRKHLIECLERGEITAFPKTSGPKKNKTLACKSSMVTEERQKDDEEKKKEEDEIKTTDNSLEKKELSPLLSFRIYFDQLVQDWLTFGFQIWNRLSAPLYCGSSWQDWLKSCSWKNLMRNRKKKEAKSMSFHEPSDAVVPSANIRSTVTAYVAGAATVMAFYFFWKKQ